MKNSIRLKVILTLISALFLISGCASFTTPEIGAIAKEAARIPLGDSDTQEGIFEYRDVLLQYTMNETDEGYTYSGLITFDRSLSYSYPVIKQFTIRMSFLDSNGMVLDSVNVTPFYNTHGLIPDKFATQKSVIKPPGSTYITFNLFGKFMELSPDVGGGEWILIYFPFE